MGEEEQEEEEKRSLAITANILNDYFTSGTMLCVLHLLSHLIFATAFTIQDPVHCPVNLLLALYDANEL